MSRAFCQTLLLLIALGWLCPAPVQAASPGSNSSGRLASSPPLPPEPALLPPPPVSKSPIAFFRELLAMDAAQRKQALTNRSPESAARILAKVHEYQLLKADERELRLQVTELQYYLVPLMQAPATNRAEQLADVPPRQRQFVEDRLREWDRLESAVQKELLENEATLRYLTEISRLTDEQRRQMLQTIPPTRRESLEKGIARWDAMSAGERRNTLARFNQFFELTAAEKAKALNTLSGPERRQIESTLHAFNSLPREQRAEAIRSFGKFANLSREERQQFLKNAERWKALTPAERQAWRDLVRNLPPPLPLDLPPMPPQAPRRAPISQVTSN